ncbi:zinc finger protein 468-like [Ornithodoros turicata]|uniref:zinc finger protein 468-like n=1 Tax=Ornithodoros turicata TaxID=34597 RepID=UPI00313901BF
MKEEARYARVLESSRTSPSDSQLQEEMQLPPEMSGQPVRVKSEPPDVACLPEERQIRQQHHDESPSAADACGVTGGMCRIKEEPQEDSANEDPILEVKTEPYNVAVLTEQDQMGHNCDSTSEDARDISVTLHIKDKPRCTCEQEYSGYISSYAQLKISTATVELQLDSTALVTTNDRHAEQHRDQSKPQALACMSKASLECHMFGDCHKESEKCSTTPPSDVQMGGMGSGCNTCPSAFSWSAGDEDHMASEFSMSRNLQQHKRTYSSKKPYKCDVCPAEFTRNAHLEQHKRTHTGDKPYKCNVCPAEFSQRGNLQRHKCTHGGEKPYKCDVCHAGFSLIGHLQRHKRTHTGEKPYECDVCPAVFSQSWHLQRHKRTHTGEKPYKCDVCPAKFSRGWNLKQHMRTHMVNKPYKCDLCPAAFRQNVTLSRHKRTHTREQP